MPEGGNMLKRGVALMDVLAEAGRTGRTLSFNRLQRHMGLTAASLSRLLRYLQEAGLVASYDECGYGLTRRVASWSDGIALPFDLETPARSLMEQISNQYGASTIVIERYGTSCLPLYKIAHEGAPSLMRTGELLTAHLPYLGTVLFMDPPHDNPQAWTERELDYMPPGMPRPPTQASWCVALQTWETGVFVDDVLYPGHYRVAAPVYAGNRVIGLIGATVIGAACPQPDQLRQAVKKAAENLSRQAGDVLAKA